MATMTQVGNELERLRTSLRAHDRSGTYPKTLTIERISTPENPAPPWTLKFGDGESIDLGLTKGLVLDTLRTLRAGADLATRATIVAENLKGSDNG